MPTCSKCKREVNYLRRGMCLSCYRKETGLSGGTKEHREYSKLLHIKERKLQTDTQLKIDSKLPLRQRLINFLADNPKELQEIYPEFSEEKPSTIRGRLNENIGKCFQRIGKGIYLADNGKAKAIIINGDCWEKIKDIESNTIDTIITDSPYSCLNKHYEMGTTRRNNVGFETKDINNDLLKEMLRILKTRGHFFSFMPCNSKDTLEYNTNFLNMCLQEGFEFNKVWIWDKQNMGMGYNGRNRYEQIYFLSKGKRRKPYNLSITDLLSHKSISPRKRIHVTEKPVELIKDIMRFSNKENDVVFDGFGGSLSTAQAGQELGINTITVEIDPEMIKKAISRRNLNIVEIEE